MKKNIGHKSLLCLLSGLSIVLLTGAAQAQYVVQYSDGAGGYGYRTEPLYPYMAQPQHSYAVRQNTRSYPYVGAKAAVGQTDPALVEELRKGRKPRASMDDQDDTKQIGGKKIHKTIVVREKPVIRTRVRVVDDPPIIVQREISEDQLTPQRGHADPMPPAGRTIRAEAEVTIIGPDRMSIRLFRKRDGSDANAKVETTASAKTRAQAKADTKSKIR